MRHITIALTTALLLVLATAPVGAEEEGPLRLEPCTGTGDVLTLDGDSTEVAAPTPLDGSTTVTYRLDLSQQEVADDVDMDDRASVTVDMSWLTPLDYDLEVNGASSAGLQPVEPSEERATTSVRHCGTVTITVVNFAATGLEPITLDTSARL